MKINLASGNIGLEAGTTNQTDKRALLVYAGVFKSMDGEVEITPAHIEVLIANHNAKLAALGDTVRMADYPPIQLDHSTSAKDTVGRLIGPLELGTHNGVVALFGNVRILGLENWEKVADGRWTHLSIGADLDLGELQELTITPFPAAKNACLLSAKGAVSMAKKVKRLMENEKISEDEAKEKLSKMTDEEKTKLGADEDEDDKTKLSGDKDADEDEDDKTKLSGDKDADDKAKLAAELSAKKLEDEEKDAEEKKKAIASDEGKAKLSAALKGFQSQAGNVRLALRAANIQSRFARLRSCAKVSPAELKKMDFVKLAASNNETLEAVLKTYEDREPVIHVGQYGSLKATSASQIAKEVKLSSLEAETRANMSTLSGKKGAKTKLSSEPFETSNNNKVEDEQLVGDHTALWSEIVKAVKEGNEDGGKALFVKACRMVTGDNVSIDETSMAALMSSFASLEDNFSSVVRLSAETSGIKL
jgi:hypothetical protein